MVLTPLTTLALVAPAQCAELAHTQRSVSQPPCCARNLKPPIQKADTGWYAGQRLSTEISDWWNSKIAEREAVYRCNT